MLMARKLVIVESPTKARKIAGYLGPEFTVEASVGHIRDIPLPKDLPAELKKGPYGRLAVDVEHGFEPYYLVNADKKAKVRELKAALKEADELYLATDEDREGEAIAWHLLQELKPKVPVRRMVFHEITKEAITRALANTRDIDSGMVDAQETRRILDRLYGWEMSPVLWAKVRTGLSAGRVQSVATRLIVDRERARMAFVSAGYWDVFGQFTPAAQAGDSFLARLTSLDGARVATGRDFNSQGELTSGATQLNEAGAQAVVAGLQGADLRVQEVAEKPYTRRPAAPFTTSTLQQEAGRKLRMGARASMRVAQFLYENGYITYIRTDSTALSAEAIAAARKQAVELYGPDAVPPSPRLYATKQKGAQEAHEAIRPAGDHFRTPKEVAGELHGDQFKLYELIWKRTVASQMADAKGFTASIKIGAPLSAAAGFLAGQDAVFSATGTVITFRGFMAAYEEGRDKDGEKGDDDAREVRLPKLAVGDGLTARDLEADGHSTNPPARFTEASLVKSLEDLGIGRPSTYASTISTIQDRGYVQNVGQALVPTWLSFAVTKLLEDHFDWLVDYRFTAKMEEDLDDIAAGDRDRRKWLELFYFGDGSKDRRGIKDRVDNLPEIDPVVINSVPLGDGMRLRVGRYGPYVEDLAAQVGEGEAPPRASVPPEMAPDELTPGKARELLDAGSDDGRSLG
ncbi:MAG: type I DNA topoisomerase, partial [Cellulomonadaceae bacterium]|nr:type I DNA topoisomerase [Cellulomonadaceae bacterium]